MNPKDLIVGDSVWWKDSSEQSFLGTVHQTDISFTPYHRKLERNLFLWTQYPEDHPPSINNNRAVYKGIVIKPGLRLYLARYELTVRYSAPMVPSTRLYLRTKETDRLEKLDWLEPKPNWGNLVPPQDFLDRVRESMLSEHFTKIIGSKYHAFMLKDEVYPIENLHRETNSDCLFLEANGATHSVPAEFCVSKTTGWGWNSKKKRYPNVGWLLYGATAKVALERLEKAKRSALLPGWENKIKGNNITLTLDELHQWALQFHYDPELLERIANQTIVDQIVKGGNSK